MRKEAEPDKLKLTRNESSKKSPQAMKVEERKEVIKTRMNIEASLKSLCVWVPLYAEVETSQVMQLSLMSEFFMEMKDVQENTIDLSIDEITKEDVLESRNNIGFSVNQL